VLELDSWLEFNAADDATFFSLLPRTPTVCLIEPREATAEPYLIRTADLQRRLQRMLGPADPTSKRLNLREFARGVRYRETGSKFEQNLLYYQQARKLFPQRYQKLTRFRPPVVLKVNLRHPYPRCFVTRRISVDEQGLPSGGAYYGPFASRRSAEAFAERVLEFFKVRRCQIKIRRDPEFPGCIYSEMKMCLAPCFAGCTKEEYDLEVHRLVSFLNTSGGSLRDTYELERDKASEDLDFEKAAAIHKKLEKLDDALRGRSELARRVQDVDAIILQRTTQEHTVGMYAVRGGRLAEPTYLKFGDTSEPKSAEEAARDYLEGVMKAEPNARGNQRQSAQELAEHLWLLSRWFYSQPREGEIFFREKDWPYRRILRACSRLLAPKSEESATSAEKEQKPTTEETK
jgi:excinuclease UvrABC nuclease subunit